MALSDTELVARIADDLYAGACSAVEAETPVLLDRSRSAGQVPDDALVAGMGDVADDLAMGALFVPEAVRAVNALFGGMAILRPMLRQSDREPVGCAEMTVLQAIASASGKDLIAMTLIGNDVETAGLVLRGFNREIRLAG